METFSESMWQDLRQDRYNLLFYWMSGCVLSLMLILGCLFATKSHRQQRWHYPIVVFSFGAYLCFLLMCMVVPSYGAKLRKRDRDFMTLLLQKIHKELHHCL
jgi:type II secretory pathway component PulF